MSSTLVPACGGTEKPFTVNGRRWLYCWDRETSQHYYLDVDRDVVVWNRAFHPAWAPELEHEPDPNDSRIIVGIPSDSESLYF